MVALAASLGSGGLPGFGGGVRGELSSRAVAPGGWLTLTGSHAPEGKDLVLESRSGDGPWHAFADASADDDGHFAVKGRVLQRPGRIEVRGRVPGGGTTKPVAVTVRPLRLAAVGDINLGDQPGEAIAANGPRYPWQGAGKALRHADLTFGNLECAVSTRGEPSRRSTTSAPPRPPSPACAATRASTSSTSPTTTSATTARRPRSTPSAASSGSA